MKKNKFFFVIFALLFVASLSFSQTIKIKIVETTDTHGAIFPYDFLNQKPSNYSLANIQTYIKAQRRDTSRAFLLFSDGDILQGTPVVYYSNFIDVQEPNICARVMNYMRYDVGTIGNHDIEAGHKVYDKVKKELNFPWLAANAVDVRTGKPYFQPYAVFVRKGIKIAVLGLITPGIPNWLPPNIYKGIEFQDMIESARKWVKIIKQKEKPDLLIGLFHSGVDYTYGGEDEKTYKNENASLLVAKKVKGFDVVFVGHDHHGWNEWTTNDFGKKVLIIGGTHSAIVFATVNIEFSLNGKNKVLKSVNGELIRSNKFPPDSLFLKKFSADFAKVKKYVMQPIGVFENAISTKSAFFGDSPFVDLIHEIQLGITGADVSFAAPLSFNAVIKKGVVYVKDMFKLYHYENFLYTMRLSGREIKDALEYSYANWFNQMKNPEDHLLKFENAKGNSPERAKPILAGRFYNFDSADGIQYVVDVTKPAGKRVKVIRFLNGKKFDLNKFYKVAVNSYRGNGGGGHLTRGAGLTKEELAGRLISSTDRDFRSYVIDWIKKHKVVNPKANNNWKVIPETWAEKGKARDWKLLFGAGEK